jgi:Tol biopolymer transport system component/predicted Ser/Thr protein kinase
MIGRTISHYRIVEKLGEGGMGVVYKAEDVKLERTVALKFLADHLLNDQDAKQRFLREARAAAALNHPNICTVFEIDEAEGQTFIAMAFLEGESLDARIARGPLPIKEALDIGQQIAKALQAAHNKGIVHRDIKPANILIAADGQVTIMDFGLARLTETPRLTKLATAVGTVAYMSPEQARGLDVDHRSDIWSLGVVLYEMVAGLQPFRGQYDQVMLYQIENQEPEALSSMRSGVPAELEFIVGKCLAKEPHDRPAAAQEIARDLRALNKKLESGSPAMLRTAAGTVSSMAAPQATTQRSAGEGGTALTRNYRLPLALAAVLALVVLVLGFLYFRDALPRENRGAGVPGGPDSPSPSSEPGTAASVPKTRPLTSYIGEETEPAFSPDGTRLAFVWTGPQGDNPDIYLMAVTGGAAARLTYDSKRDWSPAFSPDGETIAFLRQLSADRHELRTVPSAGGSERLMGTSRAAGVALGLSWSRDGQKLAIVNRQGDDQANRVYIVDVDSGDSRPASQAVPEGLGEAFPSWSPDGKSLAFVRDGIHAGTTIVVVPLRDGAERTYPADTFGGVSWTPDSTRLLFPSPQGQIGGHLAELNLLTGNVRSLGVAGERALYPAVAPSGASVAYSHRSTDSNIWSCRISVAASSPERPPVPAILSTWDEDSPAFSPDGHLVAFSSNRSGSYEIWVSEPNGAAARQITRFGRSLAGSPSWSPDGRMIAFDYRDQGTSDIYVVDASGGMPRRVTDHSGEDIIPRWSRNGRWIYFSSDRDGTARIWRTPALGGAAERVTTLRGFECLEDPTRPILYFTRGEDEKERGIWRHNLETGEETPVTALAGAGVERYWTIAGRGLYFKNFRGRLPRDRTGSPVYRLDLGTEAVTHVGRIPGLVISGPSGLAVSADETTILFVQRDSYNTDIMVATGL